MHHLRISKKRDEVYMNVADPDYPQDILPDESDLKFERLLIDGIGALMGSQISPKPFPVVARVLSSSDVIIKIYDHYGEVAYSHRRWDYSKKFGNPIYCEWSPLYLPIKDVKQLVFDFSFGVHPEAYQGDIIGVPFKYKAA
jgi:hypothetical protein